MRNELRREESERIGDDEIAVLRERLAQQGFEEAPRELTDLQDVAEATGVSVEEAREYLSRLRAERAFGDSRARSFSGAAIVGVVALLAGASVLWARTQQSQEPGTGFGPAPKLALGLPPSNSREVKQGNFLPTQSDGSGASNAPPGIVMHVFSNRLDARGNENGDSAQRMSYEVERDQIARVLGVLAMQAQSWGATIPVKEGPFRDETGNDFDLAPGTMRFLISGWPGMQDGIFALPITDKTRAQFRAAAEAFLSEVKQAQDDALSAKPRLQEGVLSPPPGFQVMFAGRRVDIQKGPRWAFAPIDPDLVVRRLVRCIANARERDAKAPMGPWKGNAQVDRKAADPKHYRIQVDGPYRVLEIDVTADAANFERELSRKLQPVREQVEKGNSLAVTKPTDGKADGSNR